MYYDEKNFGIMARNNGHVCAVALRPLLGNTLGNILRRTILRDMKN